MIDSAYDLVIQVFFVLRHLNGLFHCFPDTVKHLLTVFFQIWLCLQIFKCKQQSDIAFLHQIFDRQLGSDIRHGKLVDRFQILSCQRAFCHGIAIYRLKKQTFFFRLGKFFDLCKFLQIHTKEIRTFPVLCFTVFFLFFCLRIRSRRSLCMLLHCLLCGFRCLLGRFVPVHFDLLADKVFADQSKLFLIQGISRKEFFYVFFCKIISLHICKCLQLT